MPIITIQRRMRELGRIRTGFTEEYQRDGKTKRRPSKLKTFRITSANRELVEAVAAYYGGTLGTWESPRGPEAETIIASPYLDVIVPPGEVVDPWMELWTGGGCARRCDGVTEQLSGSPCLCPADPKTRQAAAAEGKACKPTTRLNVALPAIPDLGVWRLETHSYYAAVELTGTAETLRQATEQGIFIRARLRIDARQIKRPNEPRKDFTVPVLELPNLILDNILPPGPVTGGNGRQLGSGAPAGTPALPPGPALPAVSTFAPVGPAPATAPTAVGTEPIAAFEADPARPGPMKPDEFREALAAAGITSAGFVSEVKEAVFGDQPTLNDQERGQLAAELVKRAQGVEK